MKIEWFVADITPIGAPDRAERDILGMTLGLFWPIQAAFAVVEPLLDVEILSQSLTTFVIPAGSPAKAEHDILG